VNWFKSTFGVNDDRLPMRTNAWGDDGGDGGDGGAGGGEEGDESEEDDEDDEVWNAVGFFKVRREGGGGVEGCTGGR
jgi:hypothetical protein